MVDRDADGVVIAVNAQQGDGEDVSWLWDVKFEDFGDTHVVAAGERATDLAVRLTYANIGHERVHDPIDAIRACPPGRAGTNGVDGVVDTFVPDVCVGQAHCEVGCPLARGDDVGVAEVLELHVPEPGDVLAVALLSVDGDDDAVGVTVHHGERLLPTRRVLGQQQVDVVLAEVDGGVCLLYTSPSPRDRG